MGFFFEVHISFFVFLWWIFFEDTFFALFLCFLSTPTSFLLKKWALFLGGPFPIFSLFFSCLSSSLAYSTAASKPQMACKTNRHQAWTYSFHYKAFKKLTRCQFFWPYFNREGYDSYIWMHHIISATIK